MMNKRHPFRNRSSAGRNNKKKSAGSRIPEGIHTATVSELLTDGRGLATIDDKRVMIEGALPGETVAFRYQQQKRQFLSGETVEVLTASPDRVAPECQWFGECGGCSLQHLSAEKQIAFKEKQLLGNFQKLAHTTPKVLAAPLSGEHWGYRHRARLGVQYFSEQRQVRVGFRAKQSTQLINISACPVLAPELSKLLSPIAEMLNTFSVPDCVTEIDMALGLDAVGLSLTIRKTLTEADTERLLNFAAINNLLIYLKNESGVEQKVQDQSVLQYAIATKQPAVEAIGEATSTLPASTHPLSPLMMDFLPTHFTQVNADMNQRMVIQALEWLALDPDDCVLDLFCGLGNFTLPIAQQVKRVVGVEGLTSLVTWAKRNAENNQITNAEFYQADLTQDTRMMRWRAQADFNKILIDPPRSGAAEIMPLIGTLKPEKVLYVSCHAATLARDVDMLVNQYGYRLKKAGVMDMFPHTAHVESMALLVRKS